MTPAVVPWEPVIGAASQLELRCGAPLRSTSAMAVATAGGTTEVDDCMTPSSAWNVIAASPPPATTRACLAISGKRSARSGRAMTATDASASVWRRATCCCSTRVRSRASQKPRWAMSKVAMAWRRNWVPASTVASASSASPPAGERDVAARWMLAISSRLIPSARARRPSS